MKLLTLDPSVNDIGYSVFNSRAKSQKKAWKWGTIKPQGSNLEWRIIDAIQQLEQLVGEFDYLCTERPAFFSSERGQIAAHQNYTIDLAAVAYFIAGWYRMDHRHHFAITANQWKGSVTKIITARRFFRDFPHVDPQSLSEHAIDAIMLGRYCIENYIVHLPKGVLGQSPSSILELI